MGQPDFDSIEKLLASAYGIAPPKPRLPSGYGILPPVPGVPSEAAPAGLSYLSSLFAQKPEPRPSGIRFGRNNGDAVQFTEPTLFPRTPWGISPPPSGGLYAILVADGSCQPRPFRAVYFGQAGNLAERPTTSHEHYADWRRVAGTGTLYVAYCLMSGSEQQRTLIESGLIAHNAPVCNNVFNPFASLFEEELTSLVPGGRTEPEPAYMPEIRRLLGLK